MDMKGWIPAVNDAKRTLSRSALVLLGSGYLALLCISSSAQLALMARAVSSSFQQATDQESTLKKSELRTISQESERTLSSGRQSGKSEDLLAERYLKAMQDFDVSKKPWRTRPRDFSQ